MNRDKIKEILLANSFTIKPGHNDLKEYVYQAAEALLSAWQKKWEDQALVDIHEAVLEEREACAKLCDPEPSLPNEAYIVHNHKAVMRYFAKSIRARGLQ